MIERRLIAVEGLVQGVGFRPYVHRLAAANQLRGFVRNDAAGVLIDVEGREAHVDAFCDALAQSPPPLAAIARMRVERASPRSYDAFHIAPSGSPSGAPLASLVPPDVATCDACLAELGDPANRRHGHPFISCTDCGPRYTIVLATPYDRVRTTMKDFPMCAECRREYADPTDRRFHAETIACWGCGPTLRATTAAADASGPCGAGALSAAVAALRDGRIVALKALGGYHLACDATNAAAVARLRSRKRREAKPLAVLVRDLARAERLCRVSAAEAALLRSAARPIVLLERRDARSLADAVAPGQSLLGIMLPSTPVHHLLVVALDRPLVMTSGNLSEEPVAIDEPSAFRALAGIAELFLVHDRPIATRCDDSVVRVVAGDVRPVRRARGYASQAIAMPRSICEPVLAVGAHLKSTACLAFGDHAMVSPHVGDLGSPDARAAMRDAISSLLKGRRARPTAIAHDLHPDYGSTRLAHELCAELGVGRRVPVQHHHAHVASCAAEHGIAEPVIGVAFDGAGLGADGAIWGGEFLLVDGAGYRRCGHLGYVPLPGGDAAARRPWRSAAAHLAAAGVGRARPADVPGHEWDVVAQLLDRPDSSPRTSSTGRLFDAVASLLDICHVSRFEGEAAMRLERVAHVGHARAYDAPIVDGDPWTVDVGALVRAIANDRARRPVADVAGAFHLALADIVVRGCERVRDESGVAVVALTGGAFANALLLEFARRALGSRGFCVLMHREVPSNDGGLSLGQAWVAACALEGDR